MKIDMTALMKRSSAAMLILSLVLCSCGRAGKVKIPVWPDGWVMEQAKDSSSRKKGKTVSSSPGETQGSGGKASQASSSQGPESQDPVYDNFFPDLSQSAGAYEWIDSLYSLIRSAEGGSMLRYWGIEKGTRQLIEIDYKKIFGKKDYERSPIDYLMSSGGSCNRNAANILVTDMMTVTGAEFGGWLVSTGSESFSFYVFTMPFSGDIDFYGFPKASSDEPLHYHVKNCALERDLLMVVFGREEKVRQFDSGFQSRAQEEGLVFDYSHISRTNGDGPGFVLKPAPCFTEDLANIKYDLTNYFYGLLLEESGGMCFTLANTFVCRKSRYSANERKKAVRAVFYGIPDETLGRVLETGCQVQEYDSKEKAWKESTVTFKVTSTGYLNGFPSSAEAGMNERLGGNIVVDGKVCALSIENSSLPEGLYAVEVSVVFEAAENSAGLRQFAKKHSADISDYINALSTECTLERDNIYVLAQKGSKVFGRLLDLQGMIDELTAYGFSDPASENTLINLRLIIDNR